jgi:Flp pilus assembly protein TadG
MCVFDRFLSDSRGAVTIEFVVMFPAFIFLMIFFADTSIVYLTHTEMYNAARDTARRIATHQLDTQEEAHAYAAGRLSLGARTYGLYTDGYNSAGGVATVTVAIGLDQAVFFGALFEPILGRSLVATARVRIEPRLIPPS